MKNLFFLGMGMLLLKANVSAQILPKAWTKSGTWAGSYTMEIKANEGINESKAIVLESVGKDIYGSGAVIQTINARNYLGKRVKLSAFIRTENVKDFACLILSPQNKIDDFSVSGLFVVMRMMRYHAVLFFFSTFLAKKALNCSQVRCCLPLPAIDWMAS